MFNSFCLTQALGAFHGGLVVRTRHFHLVAQDSIPGQEIKIPQALWQRPEKYKTDAFLLPLTRNASLRNGKSV